MNQLTPSKILKVKQKLEKDYAAGGLDKKQLATMLSLPKRETDILFDYFDMDGNGVIDGYEATCALAMLVYASADLRAEFLFKLYDCDNNNYLTRMEVLDFLRNHFLANKRSYSANELEKKADEFVRLADLDMDKKVNLKEFQTFLAKNQEYFTAAEGFNQVLSNVPMEVNEDFKAEAFEEDNDFDTADEAAYDSDLENEFHKGDNEMTDQEQKIKEGAEFVTKINDGPFKIEEEMQGTEFSACKPWLGAVMHSIPSDYSPHAGESNAPDNALELEFVHGYRCFDTRNNIRYTSSGEIVYHTAAVGIVYNKDTHEQRFFFDHIDDITAMAIHPSGNYVATGEIGPWPMICVWDVTNMTCKARFNGPLQKGINHLTFSKDGGLLVASGANDDHDVAVFDWEKGTAGAKATDLKSSKAAAGSSSGLYAHTKGPRANVLGLAINGQGNTIALSCVKEMHFGQVTKGNLKLKRGTGLRGKNMTSILCCAYVGNTLVAGAFNGNLMLWNGTSLSKSIKAHPKGVTSIFVKENDTGFITGGNDCKIMVWDSKFTVTKTIDLSNNAADLIKPRLRSVCEDNSGNMIVGCRSGEIVEIEGDSPNVLLRGHYDKELWALQTDPKTDKMYTCGQEGLLAVWDIKSKRVEAYAQTEVKADHMAISPDGEHLAIGTKTGEVHVFKTSNLKQIGVLKHRKQPIGSLKYSPDGEWLCVGGVDFMIFVYHTKSKYALKKKMRGHTSRVTHIDFGEENPNVIQSNSTSYEILFHDVLSGKQDPAGASANKDETWSTYTLPIGWASQGIWPPCASGDDINAVDRDKEKRVLATADDWGKVKLFKYPCPVEKSSFNRYVGHSSHVTNVRFSASNNHLISTGGNDKAIFQWKHVFDGQAEKESEELENLSVEDSNPNAETDFGSKWDEEEFQGTEFGASKPFLGEVRASTPKGFVPSKSAGSPPKESLELKYVHGYRNFDTRNNVRYDADGNITYHAAALGVTLDSENKQTFFKAHDEDIVSFALHPKRQIAATGQMAKTGKAKLIDIFVWDVKTKEVLANLKGFHLRAVRLLKFSPDGTKLLTGGQDDDNSIAVYDWANGKMICSSPVDKARVLDGDWKSDTEFATCGLKHIKFFTLNGRNLKATKGLFGKTKITSLLSMLYIRGGKTCLTGDSKGNIISWAGRSATKSIKAHTGQVWCLMEKKDMVYSGGQDGIIKLYSASTMEVKSSIDVSKATPFNPGVRSLDVLNNQLLIGCRGGDIMEYTNANSAPKIRMQSHFDTELWGLTVNPNNPEEVLTGGGDMTLRKWNTTTNKMTGYAVLDQDFRAIDWSQDGKTIVVGSMKGKIYSLDADSLKTVSTHQSIFKTAKQWLQEIKISPDNTKVAFGGHGSISKVEIVLLKGSKLAKGFTVNPRFTSSLTHLDWSKDSEFIVCNSLAFELKFLSLGAKGLVSASAAADIEWNTWTCIFGFPVQGIWPPASTGYVINYTCMSNNKDFIACGDDFSQVKLYKNPCVVEHAEYKAFKGHSSHVPKVRFSSDDSFLFSVGGNDKCLFVWETDFGSTKGKKVTSGNFDDGFGDDNDGFEEVNDDFGGNDKDEDFGDDKDDFGGEDKDDKGEFDENNDFGSEEVANNDDFGGDFQSTQGIEGFSNYDSLSSKVNHFDPISTLKVNLKAVRGIDPAEIKANCRFVQDNKVVYVAGIYLIAHDLITDKQEVISKSNHPITSLFTNKHHIYIATHDIFSGETHLTRFSNDTLKQDKVVKLMITQPVTEMHFHRNCKIGIVVTENELVGFDLFTGANCFSQPKWDKFVTLFITRPSEGTVVFRDKLSYFKIVNDKFVINEETSHKPVAPVDEAYLANKSLVLRHGNLISISKKNNKEPKASKEIPNLVFANVAKGYILCLDYNLVLHVCDFTLKDVAAISLAEVNFHSKLELSYVDCLDNTVMLLTKSAELFKIDLETTKADRIQCGHFKFNPNNSLKAMTFWKESNLLVTAGEDMTLRFWDPERLELQYFLSLKMDNKGQAFRRQGRMPTSLEFSSCGGMLTVGYVDGFVRIYEMKGFNVEFEVETGVQALTQAKISHDLSRLAVGGDKLQLIDLESKDILIDSEMFQEPVKGLDFLPDDKYLISFEKRIIYWDLVELKQMAKSDKLDEKHSKIKKELIDPMLIQVVNYANDSEICSSVKVNKCFVSGNALGEIKCHNPKQCFSSDPILTKKAHSGLVCKVVKGNEPDEFFTSGSDNLILKWEVN